MGKKAQQKKKDGNGAYYMGQNLGGLKVLRLPAGKYLRRKEPSLRP